jgi:hypothetical protein
VVLCNTYSRAGISPISAHRAGHAFAHDIRMIGEGSNFVRVTGFHVGGQGKLEDFNGFMAFEVFRRSVGLGSSLLPGRSRERVPTASSPPPSSPSSPSVERSPVGADPCLGFVALGFVCLDSPQSFFSRYHETLALAEKRWREYEQSSES